MAARWLARSVACRASMASCECPVAGGISSHPLGGQSLAAVAFSPPSSLVSGLPGSWADASYGRALPVSWHLTLQSHRANKSPSPFPRARLLWQSVCPGCPNCSAWASRGLETALTPIPPIHLLTQARRVGCLDQSGRGAQACDRLCPWWRPSSGVSSDGGPSWLQRTLNCLHPREPSKQPHILRKAPLGPCAVTRLSSGGPRGGSGGANLTGQQAGSLLCGLVGPLQSKNSFPVTTPKPESPTLGAPCS